MLADCPSACAEDDADLIVRFALCDPSQNLRFARGETQGSKRVFHRHWFSSCFYFRFSSCLWSFHLAVGFFATSMSRPGGNCAYSCVALVFPCLILLGVSCLAFGKFSSSRTLFRGACFDEAFRRSYGACKENFTIAFATKLWFSLV